VHRVVEVIAAVALGAVGVVEMLTLTTDEIGISDICYPLIIIYLM
jgi:hypothetical protein